MATIKLKSSDGKVFSVDVKIAQQSITIKSMLEDSRFSNKYKEEPIQLPNISGLILRKVIEWANYHKDDLPDEEDELYMGLKRTDTICQWDYDFLKVQQFVLYELILAANYLDIKPLRDLLCKTVANMIKGRRY